ncbi:MAG: tripartite tricarboxylate transporter substrate binding protein [Comamonadaceae bacterium]|nr:tripartite tricarboxylate transporter substrate binding protein [Comamonadaceae bacterium]
MMKPHLLRSVLLASLTALSMAAQAAWPEKPITIVVPFGAGGNTDILARMVAQEMSIELKQPVIVDNRPGAGSMLGSQIAARAPADGYTILLGGLATVLSQHLYKKPLFDINKDLVPISQVGSVPNYLAVSPKLAVSNTQELVDLLRANPGKYSCANSGVGTSTHLSCEIFKTMTKSDIVLVPYKSGVAALSDVIGGNATMVLVNESLPYIRDGRLKGLGVTSATPSTLTPELPPVAKVLPGYDVTSWYAFFAPKGTPDAIVQRLNATVNKIIATDAAKAKLGTLGAVGSDMKQPEFAVFVNQELKRWGEIIRPMNLDLGQ